MGQVVSGAGGQWGKRSVGQEVLGQDEEEGNHYIMSDCQNCKISG